MRENRRAIFFGVGLVAFGTLLLEVDITRIFAVTLWYYFGFVAISLALLGTGAAGVLCYIDPERWTGDRYRLHMGRFSLALALLCPLVIWIHVSSDFSAYTLHNSLFFVILGMQLLGFFALFFCAGMVVAIALFRFRDEVGRLYFYDLTGAALGSLAVIFLLYRYSAPALAFAVSAAATVAALVFLAPAAGRVTRGLLVVLGLATALGLVVNDRLGLLVIGKVKSYESHGIQREERDKVFEQWSPVSRVAVFAPQGDVPGRTRMQITNDAGAPTSLHQFNGHWPAADWVLDARSNVGLTLRPDGDSLIIGSGGGMDVLSALRFNNRSVTAVEINPVIASLVTGRYAAYIGHIFEDPRVTLHVQEGRNYAAGSKDFYDLITITMIDSWAGAAAGSYIFSESTLYTEEAIDDYYDHLKVDGILSISRYYQWDEALRIATTYLARLTERGVRNPQEQIMVIVDRPRTYRNAAVLLRKGPFTPDEVNAIAEMASRNGYRFLYTPHPVPQGLMEGRSGGKFFGEVVSAAPSERKLLIDNYPRNISPSTDDRPFFFFMDRVSGLLHPDLHDHPARRLAIPILYFMFILFAVLAVLTIYLPLSLRKDLAIRKLPNRTRILLYFAGIGVGFMLVEISLIHRLTVFLGHPTYSFVVVLFSILLASGIGSLLSERLAEKRLLPLLAGVVVLVGIVALSIYDRLTGLMWLEFPARVAVSVALLAPVGLLLGMCFPLGIRWARRAHDHLIPWAWAVNGVFSVFAAAASLVVAINFGLKAMMLAGAACYLLNMGLLLAARGNKR